MPLPGRLLLVTAAPLTLAALGVVHPHTLNASTARQWAELHVLLLPIFPLVVLGFVVPLWGRPRRGAAGVATVLAWISAFGYACLYTGLDAVAGIAAGTAVRHAPPTAGREWLVDPLYRVGNQLGQAGAYAFIVAAVATTAALYPRVGARTLPGGAVLVVAGYAFADQHIFWPSGVLAMLGFALGFALLTWSSGDRRPPATGPG